MPSAAVKTLREVLKGGSPGGAYYICGEDEFQKEDAMRRLIGLSLEPSVRDFNLDVLQAQDVDARSFDGIVSSLPMMAERRVLVIRDVGALKKEGRKSVDRFLAKPSPDVVLVLIEGPGGKTDKEFARSAVTLDFDPLTADEVPRWIAQRAVKDFKVQISPAAIELLQGAVGNDLHQLVMELASFSNGREITEEAVAAVTGVHRGETVSDLLDAIGRRDAKGALGLLGQVLAQPKTTAVQIVMLLSVQTIAVAWGRARLDEGLAPGRLQSEYFNLLKQSGSVYTGRSWGSAAAAWASMVDSWNRESIQQAVEALLVADQTLKETRFSSDEQVLGTLILTMCVGDEQKVAA
jgi:DNA polymerase-3 subunit delta